MMEQNKVKTYHDHVTNTSSGQTVQSGTESLDGNDVKVSSTRVVAAVDNGADGKAELNKLDNDRTQELLQPNHRQVVKISTLWEKNHQINISHTDILNLLPEAPVPGK